MRKWESKDQDEVEESFLKNSCIEVVTHDRWHMYHDVSTVSAALSAARSNGTQETRLQAALMTARLLRHAKPIDKPDMEPLKLSGPQASESPWPELLERCKKTRKS